MKRIFFLVIAATFASFTMAAQASFTSFTTLAQAKNNCPVPGSVSPCKITFTPSNPAVPNSQGVISGCNVKGKSFQSWNANKHSHNTMAPKNSSAMDIQFYRNGVNYGYNSNGVITCFYSYTGFSGITVYSNLRSVN